MNSWPHSDKGFKARCRILFVYSRPSGEPLSRCFRIPSKGCKRPTMKRCKFRADAMSLHIGNDAWHCYVVNARPVVKTERDGWLGRMPATSLAALNKHYPRTYRPLADWSNYAR